MTVEQATGHQRAHRVDDAAGPHEQTGERRAHAQSALQFLRHQIHERQSAGKRAADHDGRRTERRNAKRAQVKQWVGDVQLTVGVEGKNDYANHQQTDYRHGETHVADQAHAGHEAAEAQRGGDDGKHVHGRARAFDWGDEECGRAGQCDYGDDGEQREDRAPAQGTDQRAGQGGADDRREHDHQAGHAVGGTDFVGREDAHDGRVHGGQHDAGADALHDSAGEQHGETGGHGAYQGTDEEAGQREQHERFGFDPFEHETHARQHHANGQHIADDHPLCGTGGYGELVHQIRQGDVHGCLGQHAEKCADVQAEHHLMRMVEMPGFGSVVGAMGISGAGFAGGHDVIGSCLDSGQRNLSRIVSSDCRRAKMSLRP